MQWKLWEPSVSHMQLKEGAAGTGSGATLPGQALRSENRRLRQKAGPQVNLIHSEEGTIAAATVEATR